MTPARLLRAACWLTLAAAWGLVGGLVYLYALDANPPAAFGNAPFPTDRPAYRAGDELRYTVSVCQAKPAPITVLRSVVGATVNVAPTIVNPGTRAGCLTFVATAVRLPPYLAPGTYRVEGVNVYRVNALRSRSVPWRTADFEVVP